MPDQLTYQRSTLQNPNVPMAAFGDYSGAQNLARSADHLAKVSAYYQEKKKQRESLDFSLEHTKAYEDLKKEDLDPADFIKAYDNLYETLTSDADEADRDLLKAQVYWRTVKSGDFKQHLDGLERNASDKLLSRTEASVNAVIAEKTSLTFEDGESILSSLSSVSDAVHPMDKARIAGIERAVLQGADSMEDLNKLIPLVQELKKNPDVVQSIKERFYREEVREQRRLKAEADALVQAKKEEQEALAKKIVSEAEASLQNPGYEFIDVESILALTDDPETIREAYMVNVKGELLSSVPYYNNEYMDAFAEDDTIMPLIERVSEALGIDSPREFFKAKDIADLQNMARELRNVAPVKRVRQHPEVMEAFANGRRGEALDLMATYLGHPEISDEGKPLGDPKHYFGLNDHQITANMIPKDFLQSYINDVTPGLYKSPEDFERAQFELKNEFGKWSDVMEVAILDSLANGTLPEVKKNPRLASYLGLTHFFDRELTSLAYEAMKNPEQETVPEGLGVEDRVSAEQLVRLTLADEGHPLETYYHYMEGMGAPLDIGAYNALITDISISLAKSSGVSLEEGAKSVASRFNEKYFVYSPKGTGTPHLVPRSEMGIEAQTFIEKMNQAGLSNMVPYGIPALDGILVLLRSGSPEAVRLFNEKMTEEILDDLFENPKTKKPIIHDWKDKPLRNLARVFGNLFKKDISNRYSYPSLFGVEKGRRPSKATPINHKKYGIGGEQFESDTELWESMLVPSGIFGRSDPKFRMEYTRDKMGNPGVVFYTLSKNLDGTNPKEGDPIRLETPITDNETGEVAVFLYRDLLHDSFDY